MDDWNEKLTTAAEKGDIEALKLSLQNGAEIDNQEVRGWTALMFAARYGHLEICKLLIDTGCKIDITNVGGLTALMFAAGGGYLEICKLLIDTGCKIDTTQGSGRTALMFAARFGHLEICKLLIDTGCKIDTTDVGGETALMYAASEGHLEICKLLIDTGCKINTTATVNGWTALMFAARYGQLETCQLLIDTGCKIDTTSYYGETALHLAAEYGHLQITRYLVEQGGASLFVKSHKGKTPYDLAAEKQYKEVMEYLQMRVRVKASNVSEEPPSKRSLRESVMSEKSSGVTAGQGMEDEMVPTEIKLMADKRSIDLYLKLLESGSEKKRDIRLVVVGKKGAGKTSLIKRLFSEKITDVTSTNGIEIHTIKCKAKADDGIWNKLDGTNEETEIHARLLKQYKGTIEASVEEGAHEAVKENTLTTILYKHIEESKESETVSQQPTKRKLQVTTESQVEPPVTSQQRNQALEQAKMDIEAMLKSNVDLHDKEEYATLLLWDFAGDEEFYHTHQTFLSHDAIYLVVTKLNEADDKNSQDLFQLWMDSIHCYSRLEENKSNSADSETSDDLDPPVVIVGTWKDAVKSDLEEIDDACLENIYKLTENMSEDEVRHIRQEYFISNIEDDPSVFQQIREDILNLAKKIKTWNKVYPLKFIQLEKRLQEIKKELPIISFHEIQHISTDTPNPLNDEELRLFLEFHHEIRALVYFKDLPSYIILDTQWLSDAFRCIVTAEKFRPIIFKNRKKWVELYSRGKLHSEVLDDIFRKSENIFAKHKDHILNVMEKFDIIIRPNISETQRDAGDDKPLYYVPCMIKSEPYCDIYEMFNVTENTCNKSTWLCYKFRFLPPHLMNHLIASLCRKYKVAEVVTKQQKRQIALFRGSAVFELQKTKLAKLHIMKCPNWIQIQVWQFEKGRQGGMYKYIDDFVTEEIVKIISTRFKMSNVKFEKKWECGQTRPESVTGSFDYRDDQDTKYYCETCKIAHEFTGEWSDLQYRTVDLLQSSANVPISNPYTESSSQIQPTVQSTKVCVHVNAGKRDYSNVSKEPPSKRSLREVKEVRKEETGRQVAQTVQRKLSSTHQPEVRRKDDEGAIPEQLAVKHVDLNTLKDQEIVQTSTEKHVTANTISNKQVQHQGNMTRTFVAEGQVPQRNFRPIKQSKRKEFDRLYKISFSFGLELIIDKRLEDEYSKLIQINNIDYEGTNSNMKEFVDICELRKTYMHTKQPMNHLIDAIRKGKNLRARWLLSNFDFERFMLDLFRNTLEVSNIGMAKALAWIITNKLFIKYKNMLNLERFRIWPGFRCICNKKDILCICSNQMEIIIESKETINDISDDFFGFKVRQLPYEKESKEARTVTSCLSEHWKSDVCCDNIVIPGTEAASLFDDHSNCSFICSSIVRSTGILSNHRIEPVRCIQLYCTVKGVIPVGEKHFPSSVCHYPTDVLEGYPLLATGLQVGEKVGTLDSSGNFKSLGTLGGFIYHLGFKCFLTCAHVVFDLETLLGRIPNEIDKTGIEVFKPSLTTNTPDNCGSVIRRIFEHSDKDKTSIDAALVTIKSTVTLDPQNNIFDQFGFIRSMTQLGLSSMDLNEICIDITSICHSKADLLCSGGFLKIKDTVTIKPPEDFVEVQFPPVGWQPHQGHAQPLMIGTTAHMQLSSTNLAGQRVFRMYNQLLLNIPLNLGDSGTCIYVIGNNEQKGCLGMAIAFLSSGQCIVTPLKEILKKLKH